MPNPPAAALRVVAAAAVIAFSLSITDEVNAHCQIPCGIFDDPARIALLMEDAKTIEKSVTEIKALAGSHDAEGQNQLVRWINNKETHASNIMEVISEYFMAQRIKPVAEGEEGYEAYLKKLADHHAVMVAAMKTKQQADLESVEALKAAITTIAVYYPHEHQ